MLLLNYQSTISDNYEKERESKYPQRGVDGTGEDQKENQGNTKFPLFFSFVCYLVALRMGALGFTRNPVIIFPLVSPKLE